MASNTTSRTVDKPDDAKRSPAAAQLIVADSEKHERQVSEDHLSNHIIVELSMAYGKTRPDRSADVTCSYVGSSACLSSNGYRMVLTWRDLCIDTWKLTPKERNAIVRVEYDVASDTLTVMYDRNRVPLPEKTDLSKAEADTAQIAPAVDTASNHAPEEQNSKKRLKPDNEAAEQPTVKVRRTEKRSEISQKYVQKMQLFQTIVSSVAEHTEPIISFASSIGEGNDLNVSAEVSSIARFMINIDTRSGQSDLTFNVVSPKTAVQTVPISASLWNIQPDWVVLCSGLKKVLPEMFSKECPGAPLLDWMDPNMGHDRSYVSQNAQDAASDTNQGLFSDVIHSLSAITTRKVVPARNTSVKWFIDFPTFDVATKLFVFPLIKRR